MHRKALILLFLSSLFLLSGCVIPLHLFITNLIDEEVVVEYQIPIDSVNNKYFPRTFFEYPVIISNNKNIEKTNILGFKYIDYDKLERNLDKSLDTIKKNKIVINKGDTLISISIKLKPKETIYLGHTTHFADLYRLFLHSNFIVKRNNKIILDKMTIAEIFDRSNRFKVNRSSLLISDFAINVALYDRNEYPDKGSIQFPTK